MSRQTTWILALGVVLGWLPAPTAWGGVGPVSTLPVWYDPTGVAVDSTAGRVYVAIRGRNEVHVIDVVTETTVGTISVGLRPQDIAVDPRTGRVYVANLGDKYVPGTVSVIDGATNAVIATVGAGSAASGIAVDPEAGRVYVVTGAGSLLVIDAATNAVVATVPLGSGPVGVAVNPVTHRVYVTGNSRLWVVDGATHQVLADRSLYCGAYRPAVNPETNRVYVTTFSCGDSVVVVDGATFEVLGAVTVGRYPYAVAVDTVADRLYVTNSGWHFEPDYQGLSILDATTDTVIGKSEVGYRPFGVAVDERTGLVYTADNTYSTLSVVGREDDPPAAAFTTRDGDILHNGVMGRDRVTGTATDARAGVRSVTVTFIPASGAATPVSASVTCEGNDRRACEWSASLPRTVGAYRVRVEATDRADNVQPNPPEITIVVST